MDIKGCPITPLSRKVRKTAVTIKFVKIQNAGAAEN
jgi:hypothetical protein